MTEKDLLNKFVRSSWKLWCFGIIAGVVIGLIAVRQIKPHYEGSVSFTVGKKEAITQDKANFYLYDGYYAVQASQAARTDLAAWIASPNTVQSIYKKAKVDLGNRSVESLAREFKSAESRSSIVDVSFSLPNRDNAVAIGTSLVSAVQGHYSQSDVSIAATEPLILTVSPNPVLVIAGSLIACLILSFGVSLISSYFRND